MQSREACNDLLAYMCNMLSLPLRESISITNRRPDIQGLSLHRHKAILTAIQNRDARGARVALDTVMNVLTPL
ncbi:DNA-binding FadR family transcriptional regulator [Pseudomonas extremaustralis]|nr:FCD domain-containing protein [Pseudomonas extremaustralis]MDR6581080.1 DNA-binding FadR family transcriptional regulator [Pseudomonas extremaustralis]